MFHSRLYPTQIRKNMRRIKKIVAVRTPKGKAPVRDRRNLARYCPKARTLPEAFRNLAEANFPRLAK